MSHNYQHIQVKPITGRIGAEISGVSLSGQLDDQVIQEINQALLQYKAIFFKAQHHLDDAEQEAFAARLGKPLNHPTVPVKNGSKHILELDSAHGARADSWHTDITFLDAYPKASILRSVVAPVAGGDTAWANTTSAYATLGLLLGLNLWVDRFFSPTLNAIKHVAVFAWIPLMIMWFGNGETSKIIFIALVVFYPVFFNTYDGVKNVSEKNKEVAQIFQLSAWKTFFKVILPSAAPSIFAGLNIALVFSWVATIGAEYFFVAAPGVVNPILDGQNLFQMEVVLYGMAIIAIVGLIFSKAAQYFENYNLRWRQGTHQ